LGIDFRDHHYAMFRAGLDPSRPASLPAPNINDGDPRETVSTLWYHDHSMDFTAENVYKGLVGFHILFDELDSGDENDPDPNALRLPSHEFDIPLLIQDKRFDANGQLFLNPKGTTDGFIGDRFVVNGAIQPKLTVLRRKYRFRLLNAGPSRFYKLFLVKSGKDQKFQIIGNDESLLEHPLTNTDGSNTSSVLISVAERAEVDIDFSQFATGDQLFLVNRLVMKPTGRGPVTNFDAATGKFIFKILEPEEGGDQILRFDVAGNAPDPSRVPDTLRLNPNLPTYLTDILQQADLKRVRADLRKLPNHFEFRFNKNGSWTINDKIFEKFRKDWCALQGGALGATDGEVWTLKNQDSTWSHPIHIHLEEFRILLRSTVDPEPANPPPEPTSTERPLPFEQGKKDVVVLGPNEEVQMFLRFRDFLGKYPIHCHNVVHEDHAMMARFDVVLERTADCPAPPTP
jgi:FtsP/CotA-like multicopper oxidase with cupredoxin domain